jgi:hypothetical protein
VSAGVRAAHGTAGGFAGSLTNFSRVSECISCCETISLGGDAGGFAGLVSNASCAEFSCARGNVSAGGAAGGFAGTVAEDGTPSTITDCVSFASWVLGAHENTAHRFAGRLLHGGINNCYSFLGSMVYANGKLSSVTPWAFGEDGADISGSEWMNVQKGLHNYIKKSKIY